MDADGRNAVQLTFGAFYDQGPSFSRDGTQVVFSRVPANANLPSEIHKVKADGSAIKKLTYSRFADWEVSFSPTDDTILFSTDSFDIWIADADAANRRRIDRGASPSYSADGKRIVFLDDRETPHQIDVYMMGRAGEGVRKLTSTGGYKSSPTFVGSGNQILFLQEPKAKGVGHLMLLDIATLKLRRVATTGNELDDLDEGTGHH